MKYLTLVFLVSGLTLRLSGSGSPMAPNDIGIGFDPAMIVLGTGLEKTERIEVYEGLPHPVGERELFESEKGSKICRQIGDQWFYSIPQEAKLELIPELQRLFDAGLFQPWRGVKWCGGFHADYAVALTSGKSTIYLLFCFGCREARIMREGRLFAAELNAIDFRLTTDLNDKFFGELRSLLAVYRKERPEPDHTAVRPPVPRLMPARSLPGS